jgi:hypothetical protein
LHPKALNSYLEVRSLLCDITNDYFYLRFMAFVKCNISPEPFALSPLPLHGQRASVGRVPLLAHETGEGTAIAKCLGAAFPGG